VKLNRTINKVCKVTIELQREIMEVCLVIMEIIVYTVHGNNIDIYVIQGNNGGIEGNNGGTK